VPSILQNPWNSLQLVAYEAYDLPALRKGINVYPDIGLFLGSWPEKQRFEIGDVIKQESRTYFRALGSHISVLRKEHGMTQAELARTLGVSQQTVFAYELGDRRVSVLMLVKLAKVFAVEVEDLMGMTKPQRPAKRRLSPAGVRHAERYQMLSKTQQRFVARIIDVLLEQNRAQ
jgi:DNA-binding XRE family transcriptional regulator